MEERVTMQIETDIGRSGKFVHTFTGYSVDRDGEKQTYHSFSGSEVDAVTVRGTDNHILRDGEIKECNIKTKITWDWQYELQLYGVSIEGKSDNYVVVTGFIRDAINVGNADQVRLYIDGNTAVTINNDGDSIWRFTDVSDNYESDLSMAEDQLSQGFSSNSDLLRIGFDSRMPESVTANYT